MIRSAPAWRKTVFAVLLCLLSSFAFACGDAVSGLSNAATSLFPAALPERAKSSATDSQVEVLVRGNSAFAFDLYQELSAEDDNLFYSPYSVSIALGMIHAGARGETKEQMADTLHFLLPQDSLHPAFNSLYLGLDSRSGGKREDDPAAFRLNVANALWGQRGYRFLDEFTTVIEENYGAGVTPLDFAAQPERSRVEINDWVARETEDRITELISPWRFERQPPALVLTNAIYFNAGWLEPFGEFPATTVFYPPEGDAVSAPMMKRTGKSGYASGGGYQAVDLRYLYGKMSMIIMLPEPGTFEAFEDSLDHVLVTRILEDIEPGLVKLTMPKFEFEFESTFDLVDTLSDMGMTDAFDGTRADFSGMDGRSCRAGEAPCLSISDVIHKAFVSVDEEGTEAAAATSGAMVVSDVPGPKVEVIVDRPFIFLVRDWETGTILFMGRVLDPRK